MKKKFELVIGLIALFEVIYKLATCPSCDEKILGFPVPGFVELLYWGLIAGVLLYKTYEANRGEEKAG